MPVTVQQHLHIVRLDDAEKVHIVVVLDAVSADPLMEGEEDRRFPAYAKEVTRQPGKHVLLEMAVVR